MAVAVATRMVAESQVFTIDGLKLHVRCIAGVESCVAVRGGKALSVAFDMGVRMPAAVHCRHCFISHGHLDHIAAVAAHCGTRGLQRLPPPTYFVPPCLVLPLESLLDASRAMDGNELACSVVGVEQGDRVLLLNTGDAHVVRRDEADVTLPDSCMFVEPFPTMHRVPSQGYALRRRHRKLKAEFREVAQREGGSAIAALRREGVEVTEVVCRTEVAYTGDTVLDGIRHAMVQEAKLLVMEMTGVDDELNAVECRKRGHIHLEDMLGHPELFDGNDRVLLVHFSARYLRDDIGNAMHRLPPPLRDKVMWADAALQPAQDATAPSACCLAEVEAATATTDAEPESSGAGAGVGAAVGH